MRRNTSTYLAGIVCAAILLFLGPGRPCHGQGLLPIPVRSQRGRRTRYQ